jgi:polysaccharide pyruvyl transferase CsaB
MVSFRALVSGYYGFGNVGDEAILAGLLQGFRDLAPEAALTVLSGDPAATEAEHGVAAWPRGLRSAAGAIRRTDLLVSGGGGLLQDATSWRSPLYYLWVLRTAQKRGARVACIGHSVGPLRRGWVRRRTRGTLEKVDVVAVRDHRSEETLQALGLRHPVQVTGDLAFLLPRPPEEGITSAWRKTGLARDGAAAALALRTLPGGAAGPELEIAAAAIAACAEIGARPVLVPMQHPVDLQLADAVAARHPSVTVARARLTARETLALLAGFDLVIAMRLHALIFAAIGAVPPVAVSYDPKVDGMMSELGFPVATSCATFSAGALTAAIAETWRSRAAIAVGLAERAPQLAAAARRNIELCVELMERGT